MGNHPRKSKGTNKPFAKAKENDGVASHHGLTKLKGTPSRLPPNSASDPFLKTLNHEQSDTVQACCAQHLTERSTCHLQPIFPFGQLLLQLPALISCLQPVKTSAMRQISVSWRSTSKMLFISNGVFKVRRGKQVLLIKQALASFFPFSWSKRRTVRRCANQCQLC